MPLCGLGDLSLQACLRFAFSATLNSPISKIVKGFLKGWSVFIVLYCIKLLCFKRAKDVGSSRSFEIQFIGLESALRCKGADSYCEIEITNCLVEIRE